MTATHAHDFNNEQTPSTQIDEVAGRSSDRPISQILQEMVGSITEIVKSEMRLASTEIKNDLAERSKAAAYLGVSGVFSLYAVGLLLLGLVYALSTVWPAWLAAIVPGVVLAVAAGVCFSVGRERVKRRLKMQMTAQTVEDNVRWLKNQMK